MIACLVMDISRHTDISATSSTLHCSQTHCTSKLNTLNSLLNNKQLIIVNVLTSSLYRVVVFQPAVDELCHSAW